LSRKLKGQNDFTRKEMEETVKYLGINPTDIAEYFFAHRFVNTNKKEAVNG